jgi:hypothetical protein
LDVCSVFVCVFIVAPPPEIAILSLAVFDRVTSRKDLSQAPNLMRETDGI